MSSFFEFIKEFFVDFWEENFGGFASSALWGNHQTFEEVDSINWCAVSHWLLLALLLFAFFLLNFPKKSASFLRPAILGHILAIETGFSGF